MAFLFADVDGVRINTTRNATEGVPYEGNDWAMGRSAWAVHVEGQFGVGGTISTAAV